MNHWWGEPWPSEELRAPICEDDDLRTEVPVGQPCQHCGHVIEKTDRGTSNSGYIGLDDDGEMTYVPTPLHAHAECGLRHVRGCSASIKGEGHSHERDYREDAWEVWEMTMGKRWKRA